MKNIVYIILLGFIAISCRKEENKPNLIMLPAYRNDSLVVGSARLFNAGGTLDSLVTYHIFSNSQGYTRFSLNLYNLSRKSINLGYKDIKYDMETVPRPFVNGLIREVDFFIHYTTYADRTGHSSADPYRLDTTYIGNKVETQGYDSITKSMKVKYKLRLIIEDPDPANRRSVENVDTVIMDTKDWIEFKFTG
jgi:hypothetical protein